MTNGELVLHVEKLLQLFKDLIAGEKLTQNTGMVNVKGDDTIGMDIKVEEEFVNYLKKTKLPVSVFSEENGIIPVHTNPEYLVAFDPLDGSTNYKIGNGLLPYGCLIAFYRGNNPKLKDVVAAGATEITKNLSWIYDGKTTKDSSGKMMAFKKDWEIGKHTPIYLDLYYKEGYNLYSSLPEKLFIRNTGSTIGNLTYLMSNVSTGLGGICMRPEEIGAIYSLIKGSGGMVVDNKGKDLGEQDFDTNSVYPILGGVKNIVEFCVKELNK